MIGQCLRHWHAHNSEVPLLQKSATRNYTLVPKDLKLRTLGLKSSFYLKMLLHCLLACIVSYKESAVFLILFLYITRCYVQAAFKIFTVTDFERFYFAILLCIVIFLMFLVLRVHGASFLDPWVYGVHHIWENFGRYFSHICFCSFSVALLRERRSSLHGGLWSCATATGCCLRFLGVFCLGQFSLLYRVLIFCSVQSAINLVQCNFSFYTLWLPFLDTNFLSFFCICHLST